MVVMDARTQQVQLMVDQLFSLPKCARLAKIPEKLYDLLTKIIRAVPKRSEGELQDIVGEDFRRLSEDNVSELQRKKASGVLPTGSFRKRDPKEHLDNPWRVSLSLPGADVMVHQTREPGVIVGHGGVVLHEVVRPKSTSVNCSGYCHAGG